MVDANTQFIIEDANNRTTYLVDQNVLNDGVKKMAEQINNKTFRAVVPTP